MNRLAKTVLASLALAGLPCLARADTWRIVVLPDTQHYTNLDNDLDMDGTSDYLFHFQNQIDWIVANKAALNIVFVSHTGDIVQRVHLTNPPTEWLDADEMMSGLDGVVPYGAVAGNHDILNSGLFPFNYIIYFGPARYSSYYWYGGSSPNELSHYQRFQVQGDYGLYRFTHISAQWQLPGVVDDPTTSLGWVQQVIDRDAPLRNILFSTHATIDTDNEFGTETWGLDGENTPEEIRHELLEPNSAAIDLVLSGHFHTPGDGAGYLEVRRTPVLMADYQSFPEGGQGYLRIIEFIEGGGNLNLDRIQVRTYSPSLDQNLTDPENEFFIDRNFHILLNPQPDATPLPRPPGRGVTPG
jgi:hypothetical protein